MGKYMRTTLVTVIFLAFVTISAEAQQNRFIEIDDPAYEYISRLQHHGYLLGLNPTSLPYTEGEVLHQLEGMDQQVLNEKEKRWVELLHGLLKSADRPADSTRYGLDFSAGSYMGNSRRKSALRPIDNDLFLYPQASLGGYLEYDRLIAHGTIRHDLYYDRDPDGLDAARRLYIRSEEAYLGYNGDWLKVYVGRFKNHWAPYGEASSILSANPNSFDQIHMQLGNEHLSLQSVIGELDNINGNNIYTGKAIGPGVRRRYIAAHRFDWRLTRHFGLAFFESVIYSGENSGFSFKYLNPLHAYTFVTDNNPKNDENNLLLGGMLWGQFHGWTLNGQLLFDDFQVEDVIEKNTFTVTASLYKARLFPNTDLGAEFEAVSYQTYNPTQPEGRYLYLKRGLATQFNDYIRASLYANIYSPWGFKGFRVTPKVQLLFQGEQTINQPLVITYPDGRPIDYILTGTAERTVRPSLSFRYQKGRHFWIEGDAGMNFVENVRHQSGVENTRFAAYLRFGVDLALLQNQ